MSKFLTRSTIIFLFLCAACFCGCKPSSVVKGQMYVITKAGSSVKLAGTQVFLVEETALRNRIKELNTAGGFEPALKIAKDTFTKQQIAANFVTLMFQNPDTKGFRSALTGADGNFSFEHVPAGSYLLYARGSREVFSKTEYYVWFRKFAVKTGYDYTADLQNESNVMTDATIQPTMDLARALGGNRPEVDKFLADKAWVGLLAGYGLSVP